MGGAFRQSGKVFLQKPDGSFTGKDLTTGPKSEEDMQSVLFDANGDGHPDLLIVSGSSEFNLNSPYLHPRLYINDGKGNFKPDLLAFAPDILTPGKAVAVADYDGDGQPDVFIGGRVSVGEYPASPKSFLLHNDHGRFTDVTASVCPALDRAGMINAAVWLDIDNDKRPDLIIAGDWMGLRVFHNNGHTLNEITDSCGLTGLSGFWRSLAIADVNHDGRPDIIAGNTGMNNPWHISAEHPAELYTKDFDGNGIVDPIFCYYIRGEDGKYEMEPAISRDEWFAQMPGIKKKFPSNEGYAKASMKELFTSEMMKDVSILTCREERSGWFENRGDGKFVFHPFPLMAQIAPVNAIVCTDVDGDGNMDLLLAGNEYQAQVSAGGIDASYGLLLKGDGKGDFTPVEPGSSGLILDGDIRDLKMITAGGRRILLVATNDEKMKAFAIKKK